MNELKHGMTPKPNQTLLHLLNQRPQSISTVQKLHAHLITTVHHASNPSLLIKLMRAYSAAGKPTSARQLFDAIPDKNIVFFNVMIRSYANNKLFRDAILVFSRMPECRVKPDNYTYPCVLKACAATQAVWVGMQIHCGSLKYGFHSNVFVGNALVSMYARSSCLDDGRQIFNEMHNRDVVSWNAMVAGYAQEKKFKLALDMCKEMVDLEEVMPDAGTMASLLPAVLDTDLDGVLFVRRMFDGMCHKGLVSCNAMIAVYVSNGMADEGVEIFRLMEAEGVEPDAFTFASLLPACGDLSALKLGRRIHYLIDRKKMGGNLLLENALIDMYSKCGCSQLARKVFDSMKAKDVVSWTSMISACGMSGSGKDAMALFEEMQRSGPKPDHIAFVSILSACSHSGLLSEGRKLFHCMRYEHGITPTVEHLACMVDLLGRSGNIEEAFRFITQMHIEPNERVWGALLSACHMYSNVEIGLLAADNLFELAPGQSGYYVLLSNIYAKAGRWEDVSKIRKIMKNKGLNKTPGCSNVEFGNKVHTFLVGDRSHPQSDKIYAELDVLVGKLKEAGYVAEVDSALHDVEEEDKEGHLAVHSEKLAIVFMLINTGPGTVIRVTKNLRVCTDCHTAAKFISKVTEREIVLRDNNRFHQFVNGACSCADYW